MYKAAHAAIRKNPARKAAEKKDVKHKRYSKRRLNLKQRKAKVAQKKAAFIRAQQLAADEDEA